jgi:uncharacterized protein (DUF362 family)/NAD-dependent dihydropyrimidine dehydrogenase PreA subunit
MKKSGEKVAIVKCNSYNQKEVDRAVKKIFKLLDFPSEKYKKVLIKPNIVGYFKENLNAIITNPSIVKSLLKIFRDAKIGESSFTNTENNFRKTGYWNLKPLVFEEQKLVKINDNKAKVLKHFYLPKIIKESDLIIDVSKLKTHTLVKMTGAIKNLYGCIPGGEKQIYHRNAKGEEKFSKLLVDIYQNIKPGLNIMDAVIAMEGEGPSSGKPRKAGLLLASKNAVSLDIAAAKLMGYRFRDILTTKEALKRNLGNSNIEIVGDLKKIPNLKFKKPSQFKRAIAKSLLLDMAKEKIVVDENKCVKCGLCSRKCPMKSITLNPYPVINEKRCIRCFCCIEICPQHALSLKSNIMGKVKGFVKKMRGRKKK